ncbi:electron transfer flavoprotein subunit alpha/FixB family protein [Asticcacaulis sp. EMRT-3]|uniref:electron transfer flavoprotein subunit alpha/FixB family protein n=1 Tax=Asticcacaulis sp. EMRT-3 TaxID=3040349 RepID=UPI0024AEFE4B|nr:electron transfer flavoprotein subunit alpha/FixB family protein [Asticcacaulis sp. EMRT-3]MDI7775423.1 electron transfer flavoprotein subunit alpha/FixB family protein [Asticcacaulis sp. EMRT-3]
MPNTGKALVIADHDGAHLRDTTLKTITAAKALSADIDVLVYGDGCQAVAETAAKIAGVGKVLLSQSQALKEDIAEDVAVLVAGLAASYDAVAVPASTSGKNFAPRVAALLDVSLISDVMQVVDAHTFVRPIYAGNALETIQTSDAKIVMTVRTTAFAPAAGEGGSAAVENVAAPAPSAGTRFISEEMVVSDRPELGSAKVVVSGGRALGSKAEFDAVLNPLAEKLNAAVGASRAAVDAGYAPNDYQVGQTGKVVAPDLYIAIGISGAIQHLAGMKDSKVIVAINKDAEAPIFGVADFGLVADYQTAIPELMKALG